MIPYRVNAWLWLLLITLLASCENTTSPVLVGATAQSPVGQQETPTGQQIVLATPTQPAPGPTPARKPTLVLAAPPDLPLAYSTADGIFLWNPRTGGRKQIAGEPAARLGWAVDGAWLAATDTNPFHAIQIRIVTPDGAVKSHRLESNFTFPVWSGNSGEVLALPCPGSSGRPGDFQIVDPARGPSRIAGNAEVWPWLPNVAPDLSKALITPFNAPYTPTAVVIFDDWRAPLILESVHFPSCPDAYAWSPDSRYLAYYDGGRFWVLDLDEPKPPAKLIGGPATLEPINVVAPALAWSPDGKQLALALKGQVWIADLGLLNARTVEGLTGIYSGLSWAPAARRSTASSDGVLSQLMPYLNPADFYDAFVQVEGRPAARIIAASTDVLAHGPFVYLDYGQRRLFTAAPPMRLKCPLFRGERPQAPALRQNSEQTGSQGQETIVVNGGWYMAQCRGTLVYQWDGSQLQLTVETSAIP